MPQRSLLIALLLDFLIASAAYNALIPVFEQPDEHGHFFFAQHLAQTGELPVQVEDVDARGPWEQEGSQPPLYYYLTVPIIQLTHADLDEEALWYNHQNSMGTPDVVGNENRFVHPPEQEGWPWTGYALAVHLGRFLSSLLGAVTVLCTALLARRIFPGRRWLVIATAGLVAFNPQFLALSASFSNDNAIIALSALTLLLLSRISDAHAQSLTRPVAARDGEEGSASGSPMDRLIPLLAIVVGLAPLAKLSGLALLGFTLLTLAWLAWRRKDPAFLLKTALPVALAAAVLSGWWYARNLRLYESLTGLNYMLPGAMGRSWRLERWLTEEAWGELWGIWYSSWGLFGWFTVLMPRWIYRLITLLAIVGLGGLGWAAWRWRQGGERAASAIDPQLDFSGFSWIDWPRLAWIWLWAAIVFTSLMRWLMISKGGQGRLLFPAIAALGIGLVAGWRIAFAPWLERIGKRLMPLGEHLEEEASADPEAQAILSAYRGDATLAGAVLLTMYLFAAYALFFVIRPAYAWPETIEESQIPDSAIPAGVTFGEGLTLLAVEHPERVTEGERFPVTLYWRVDGEIERDGYVGVRTTNTIDASSDSVIASDMEAELSYVGAGVAPPRLLAGSNQVYVDRRQASAATSSFEVGQDLTGPLASQLRINVFDREAGTSWPIQGQDSSDAETRLVIEPTEPEGVAIPSGPPLVRFENGLSAWVDDAVSDSTVWSGETYRFPASMTGWPGTSELIWSVEQPVGEDLQIFLHLLDDQDRQVGSFDQSLRTPRRYSVGQWAVGETLITRHPWHPDPPETEDGRLPITWVGTRYSLRFGLYRLDDGSRIPAFDLEGNRYPDDAVPLHDIEIVE